MKWILLIAFAMITIYLLFTGCITIKESYIGTVIMLAAEYIEDAIQRRADNG